MHESVIDRETRVPLRRATVTATWREAGRERHVNALTDSSGRVTICIPAQLEVGVRVSYRSAHAQPWSTVPTLGGATTHTTALDAPFVYARGQVVDHSNEAPVPNAAVRLVRSGLEVLTGADGRFVFPRIPVGEYELRIEHPSYATTSTALLAEQQDLQALIRVTPEAIPLEPVVVTAFSRRLDNVGFYEREKRGVGSFIGRSQIESARAQFASDLLRRIPGVRLITTQARRDAPRSFTMGRGNCRFRFVLDGTRVLPDFELDNISPLFLEGLEVYAGLAQVPAEFRAQAFDGSSSICGVIVVWTKDRR